MKNKEEFKRASLGCFKKHKDIITDKEETVWDFMATAQIESMTYKDGAKNTICIKLNSLFFRSPLD